MKYEMQTAEIPITTYSKPHDSSTFIQFRLFGVSDCYNWVVSKVCLHVYSP